MIRVTATTTGLEALALRISRSANFLRTGGVREILNERAKAGVAEFKANIDSFTPGEVQDLAESTKKTKLRKYGREYPILKATGQLYESIKAIVSLTSSGWVINFSYGNRQKIAEYHIKGMGHNPIRNFAKLSTRWLTGTHDAIRAGLRRR